MQGISLFGVELASNTGLLGYNVYHNYEGGNFELIGFTTETNFLFEEPEIGTHCFYVTAVYDFLESEPSNEECEEIVTVEESLATSVQIFPNPASTYVNIKSDFTIDYVTIYNFAGQAVASEQVKNNNYTVNVAEFNPGVYIFQIETTEGRLTARIIIE
jgi:hypothetical protein